MTRAVLIQGHPDPAGGHYGHALADAYAAGAAAGGHEVRRIEIAALDFPLLRRKEEWERGDAPPALAEAQEAIRWCGHIVLIYPLWLGTMPALVKGFLEQTFRPSLWAGLEGGQWKPHLTGRSARVVVTMGMPALAYRWYFGAHSLKSLERNVLKFSGIRPVRHSLIGTVEGGKAGHRERWLEEMETFGRACR